MSKHITIALPKGRLADRTIEVLERCDIDCSALKEETDASGKYKFISVKPSDVPTYIERGVADIGIAGKDTLLETSADVYEVANLGFGKCKMCVAGFENRIGKVASGNLKVATKYENIARQYYESGKTLKANGLVVLEEICELTARLIVNKISLKLKAQTICPLIKKITEALSK